MSLKVPGLNSSKEPATWDGSLPAFEQRALGHNDSIVPADEIGHLQDDRSKMIKFLTFRIAGNKPKSKAGQYVVANDVVDVDWRVILLSTSEDPIRQATDQSRPSHRVRGEDVRVIDVPACISESNDIWDGPEAGDGIGSSVEGRARFVEALKVATRKYQGEPFRAFLAELMADRDARKKLKKHVTNYCKKAPLPNAARSLARIQQNFAVVYAGAALAIDYQVLGWKKKRVLAAIRSCMDDAMKHLIAPARGTIRGSDAALVAQFNDCVGHGTFVHLDRKRRPKSLKCLKGAAGIVRLKEHGNKQWLLFSRKLEHWFPDITIRRHLTALLSARRVIGKGRNADTNTRQVAIKELGGRIACYELSRKRPRRLCQQSKSPKLVGKTSRTA